MTGTPLIFGDEQRAQLRALRTIAAEHPVDISSLAQRLKTPEGKRAHMDQMNAQSISIPLAFLVTFSIETGHPVGACRHMSMSSEVKARVPTKHAVWMIAEELGFSGGLTACTIWVEELRRPDGRAMAVNLVQPIDVSAFPAVVQ